MCGIAGAASSPAGPPPGSARFDIVRRSLHHRGPDAQGEYRDRNLWFGHQRLSILDLSEAANQPMVSPSRRFVICYNGEVYNYRELAEELSLQGLRTSSDTEVVLRAFEELGVASLRKLNGMFGFAVYGKDVQKLWLVRDRLGIKPLYYRFDSRGLVFGSEIKAITAHSEEASLCDLTSLHEWLFYGSCLGGKTLYQGVKQLLPGHYLELDLESFTYEIREYWSLESQAALGKMIRCSPAEMITETRHLLEQAVRRRLVSDVPVGVFLSGGVDSSAITAFAAKHYDGRLATYSAGFDDRNGVDERPKARRIAEHYGTEHHELQIDGGGVADLVEKMVYHHDMPFSDAANIPLYLMASQISEKTKVVLQGDGGDELFGGYRRYVTLRYHRLLHILALGGQQLHRLVPGSGLRHRVRRYLYAFAKNDIASTMALLLTAEDGRSRPASAFSSDLQRAIEESDPFRRYRECYGLFADHDMGNQMSLVDLAILLPDVYLEKVDRATMAASLEVRVPFLDHELVEYIVRIPGRTKMPWGKKKWLLKKALTGIVPDDVLYGPKIGFGVPFGYWLRTSLKPMFFDHLATFKKKQPGVLNSEVIDEWYRRCEVGRRDHDFLLWKLLNFMVWCNNSKIVIDH